MKAIWNGEVIAESDDIVMMEGNAYFPRDSLREDIIRPNIHTSECYWKGTANYYDIEVNNKLNPNAVWYYSNPSSEASLIKGRVAFWKGVKVIKK
jgi:uncharacterized protein (DUF427 family)